jgi:MFS family permease
VAQLLHTLRPYLVVALLNASEGMMTMLAPPYLDSLGFAPTAVGLLVSAFGVATLVSRLPAGALYQRRRPEGLLIGSLVAIAAASVLYPRAVEPWSILGVRALHGLAYGLATTINLALFIDQLPPTASRHRAMGYFMTALSVGFTVGQLIAGFAGNWFGFGWAFALAGLPTLLALPGVQGSPLSLRKRGADSRPAAGSLALLGGTLRAFRAPGVLPVALLGFFLTFFMNVASTFMPLYALAVGFNLAEIGILRSLHSVCNSITRPFTGGFIERVGYHRIAVATLAFNALLLVFIPSLTTMLALGLLMTVIGLVRGIAMVANSIGVATDIDETQVPRGLASGIYYGSRDLGGIFGPIIAGMAAGALGIETMFRMLPPVVLGLYLLGLAASGRRAAGRSAAPARSP